MFVGILEGQTDRDIYLGGRGLENLIGSSRLIPTFLFILMFFFAEAFEIFG
jgi:hypothetical protein